MARRQRDGQKRAAKVAARRRRRSEGARTQQPRRSEERDAERRALASGFLGDLEGGEQDATDEMLAYVQDQVREVVAATLEQGDADIARVWTARLVDADEHVSEEDDDAPGQWFADFVMTTLLVQAGRTVGGGDLARRVVAWVGVLGHSGPVVERLAAALLDQPTDVEAIGPCVEELDEDYLPVMVWLLAGVVAVAGDGDVGWLDTLDPAETTAAD